jgi:hypothetical protein
MSNNINNNSNRYNQNKCVCRKVQSYNRLYDGKDVILCSTISCKISKICKNNQYKFDKYVNNQQNLYALMRHKPESFPIIDSVKRINLTPSQQRSYSNMWYRQFGTSQALPVNDNWGGFNLVGSDVPYIN